MAVRPRRSRPASPRIWRGAAAATSASCRCIPYPSRDYLETVETRLGAVPTESVVRFGAPEQEILVEAEAFDADLIVLAAERRGWLARLRGGGLGERLLQASPVPVALIRAA